VTRAAAWAALDALEAGGVAAAVAVLLAAVDDEPDVGSIGARSNAPGQPFACPDCSAAYRWPGLLARHRGLVHGVWTEAA
jgi:hypothetical protein